MALENVVMIPGNLRNAHKAAVAQGLQLQRANEVMRDRRDENDLLARDWFGWVADGIVYFNKIIEETKRAFLA